MKKIILIGDSIRIGYLPHVQEELKDQAEVWGPTINGGDSRNVLAHLDEWISPETALIHINCGLHDLKRERVSKRERDAGETQVPLTEYSANVQNILSRIQAASIPVVWATTTPVNEEWHHQNKPFDRLEEDVRAFNAAAMEVAQKLNVPVNDLYSVVTEMGRDEHLTSDGVHFTPAGYAKLGRAVTEAVRTHIS